MEEEGTKTFRTNKENNNNDLRPHMTRDRVLVSYRLHLLKKKAVEEPSQCAPVVSYLSLLVKVPHSLCIPSLLLNLFQQFDLDQTKSLKSVYSTRLFLVTSDSRGLVKKKGLCLTAVLTYVEDGYCPSH